MLLIQIEDSKIAVENKYYIKFFLESSTYTYTHSSRPRKQARIRVCLLSICMYQPYNMQQLQSAQHKSVEVVAG